jgi:zinc protease
MIRGAGARPKVESFRLANGLRVLLAPLEGSPTSSVWVWYQVGSKNEHPGITGASHWVEHMLFEGSPRYAKGAIDRAIIEVGGELNAFTDTDFTAYFSTVPRGHLSVPLDIESDRMTRALLTDAEVERERTVIHSEREGNENWPEFRVEEETYQLAFRVHPYRWDALGRKEDIERLTPAELRAYYQKFYGTRNALLVVSGGFEPRSTAAEIRRRFSKLPASGADVSVGHVEPAARGERRAELSGPGTTPYLQMAWRSPALDDPATPATMLIDTILGGESRLFSAGPGWGRAGEHPSARLCRALVEKGLAVRATSEWRPRVYPSLFTVQAQAARGVSLDRLETALGNVVERLARGGPTTVEMQDARTRIRRGAALAYEGASRTGFRLGYFSVLHSPEYEDKLFRQLLAVRAEEVRDRARELFRTESRVVVRYEPTGGSVDE